MQLPVFTRGIGAEILRRLDPAGGIDLAPGSDPMESLLSAVAAHPRARRRVREVMQELIDGGWLVLSGRRWEAYLPDLERTRPCAETTLARAETAVSGSQPESHGTQPVASVRSLGAQNELSPRNYTNDVSQGEEREKERRGEGEETRVIPAKPPVAILDEWAGAIPPPSDIGTRAARYLKAFSAGFKSTGEVASPWMHGFGTSDSLRLAEWLEAEFPQTPTETAEALGKGFARNAYAKRQGFRFRGSGGLIDGPGEFLKSGLSGYVRPDSIVHETTSDEDFRKALKGTGT